MSIQPLPSEVVAQIKSSTTITSLNGVIFELLKNSLDAGPTKIELNVDYGRGACTVEDNGQGILPSEFDIKGGLGKLYHSSKLNSKTVVHGGTGTFLASLSAMSLLTITSHHHMYRSHNTLIMHNSEVISRQTPATPQQHLATFEHGTRVTVRDLFGSMPVRVKQRSVLTEKSGFSSKEWNVLKRSIISLLLPWPTSISLVLRDANTSQKLMLKPASLDQSQISNPLVSKSCNILLQAALITPEERSSWVPVRASTSRLEVKGCISLIPSATKNEQYIALGIQPLLAIDGRSTIHDEINRLFQNSSFGSDEENEVNETEAIRRTNDSRYKVGGYTNKELKMAKKGVDRWPMYYINVNAPSTSKVLDIDHLLDDQSSSLSRITELLQVMIQEFLTKHHFRPRKARENQSRSKQPAPESIEGMPSVLSINTSGPRRELPQEKSRAKDFGHLGVNVKFPSMRRQHSQQDSPLSPFDGWSRVKSGTARNSTILKIEAGSPTNVGQDIPRPASTPLPTSHRAISLTSRTMTPESHNAAQSSRSSTPLLSSTGKLARRPFDDVCNVTSQCVTPVQNTTEVPPLSHNPVPTDDDKNTIITWINPITKVATLVNQRTGFSMPAQKLSTPLLTGCTIIPSKPCNDQERSPSPWLTSLLKSWQNPVFAPTEAPIPHISCSSSGERLLHGYHDCFTQVEIDSAFNKQSLGLHSRISKEALTKADVIAQVDQKFILAMLPSISEHKCNFTTAEMNNILILIDQHAASERVLIESLLQDLCSPSSATSLATALIFTIPVREVELFRARKLFFETWRIRYDIESVEAMGTTESQIRIRTLPDGIAGRCIREPRTLIDFLRTEVHRPLPTPLRAAPGPSPPNQESPIIPAQLSSDSNDQDWLTRINNCPQGLISMLNSRACRSAIMFNDILTKEQCEILVKKLAKCAFPFQCAHGRPSLVPVVELSGELSMLSRQEEDLDGFGRAMKRWKEGARSVPSPL